MTIAARPGTRLIEVVRALDAAGIDAHRRPPPRGDARRRLPDPHRQHAGAAAARSPHEHSGRPSTRPARRARRGLVSDTLVLARRNLAHVRQIPEKLLDVTLQPLMFVLLFAYVFGGVIHVPGGNYREYLIGGILVQTLAFGIMGPATSIATDLSEGIVDRFRSLPMSRSAYLLGHMIAELAPRWRVAIACSASAAWSSAGASTPTCRTRSPASALLLLFALRDALGRHAARRARALARRGRRASSSSSSSR